MSTLNDTDLFVIERSGTQYQVGYEEMSTLNETDLFVVEREGVQYKVEAVDVVVDPITGEFETPVEVLTPLNGAGIGAGAPYNPISSPIVTVGAGGTIPCETDTITSVDGINAQTQYIQRSYPQSINKDLGIRFNPKFNWDDSDAVKHGNDALITVGDAYPSPTKGKVMMVYFPGGKSAIQFDYTNGGGDSDSWYQDLWASDDGINWTHLKTGYKDGALPLPTKMVSSDGRVYQYFATARNSNNSSKKADSDPINTYEGFGSTGYRANTYEGNELTLTFPSSNGFDCFPPGTVVQDPDVKVISQDEDANTITVDGGEWQGSTFDPGTNQADVWSQYWDKPIATAERSFDDDLSQQGSHFGTGVAGPVIWNPPNITFADKVEVYFYGAESKVKYNNDSSFTDITPQTWTTIATGGGTLEQVAVDRDGDPVYGWSAIRVDGLVLKDAAGATKLIKETPYDASLTCSDNAGLINMIGPITMTDENGDVVTPQTSEITNVSGSAPAITLTFTDNTDLEYFLPGDVVSQVGYDFTALTTGTPLNGAWVVSNAYDGNAGTSASPAVGTKMKLTIPGQGIPCSTSLTYDQRLSDPKGCTITVNDTQDFTHSNYTQGTVNLPVPASGFLTSLEWNRIGGGNAIDMGTIKCDGVELLDSDFKEVRVVSTDLVNNQMVVDGGKWDVSNQSQTWSANPTNIPAVNTDKGFNGTDEYTSTNSGPGGYFTIASVPNVTNVRFVKGNANWGGQHILYVEDSDGTKYEVQQSGTEASLVVPDKSIVKIGGRPNGGNTSIDLWAKVYINNALLLDPGITPSGDSSITGDTLTASATDVIGVDGNTLRIDGVSGTWKTGLRIKGASISSSAPSPESVVFTSSNGGSTAVTGTDASLTSRVWTLESGDDQNGPWTVVGEYTDLSANDSQDGATPWSGRPVLEANKYYQVKVKYTSDNAEPVESVFNTFKTGDSA